MSTEPEKAGIPDHIKQSLTRANIGKLYHERSLREFGEAGVEWTRWSLNEGREHVKEGRAIYVWGPGSAAVDATILLARAFHLKGTGTYVISMMSLLTAIEQGHSEVLDSVFHANLLTVTRFFNPTDARDLPLTAYQRAMLEQRLYDRLEEKKPLLLHGTKPLTSQQPVWWRSDLLEALGQSLHTIEVKK